VTIENVFSVVHDYNNYPRMYRPAVASSKQLACTDRTQEVQMVWQRKLLFISAAMQGDYETHDVTVDAHRAYSIADAVEVREIERYGHSDQRLLAPGTGNGFIWRIRSIARYEERDGGVYMELEAMALTRDVPASLTWLVNPAVNHLSIDSLMTTLRQTRDAVISAERASGSLVSRVSAGNSLLPKAAAQ